MKKTFILDTNVILNDPACIFNFDEHDLIIPIIVLEELDKFKKGNDWVNQNARMFTRTLSKLSDENINKTKISLGEGKGCLQIPFEGFEANVATNNIPIFQNPSVDNQLLSLCLNLKVKYKNLAFVTKDINLRMKARALNIEAQDYESDTVDDPATSSPGYHIITGLPSDLIDDIYAEPDGVPFEDFKEYIEKPVVNEYYLLKNGKQSAIVQYRNNILVRILDQHISGIKPKNFEQILATDLLLNPDIPLVALTGLSGSGKTLLSLAAAVQQKKNYLQIYLARPIVPLGNDIGFLPGSVMEKLDPYMQPLYDNLEVIKKESGSSTMIQEMLEKEKIKIIALPYLRGRSLPRVFFIIDEAQNLTPHEIKAIVTRAGEGAKIIFTGDINQIDSPYMDARSNGLSFLIHKMKGQELFGHIHLIKGERSRLAELASIIL